MRATTFDRRSRENSSAGRTATDLDGRSGSQTVTEGTGAIVALATEGPGGGTGRFVSRRGEVAR